MKFLWECRRLVNWEGDVSYRVTITAPKDRFGLPSDWIWHELIDLEFLALQPNREVWLTLLFAATQRRLEHEVRQTLKEGK